MQEGYGRKLTITMMMSQKDSEKIQTQEYQETKGMDHIFTKSKELPVSNYWTGWSSPEPCYM